MAALCGCVIASSVADSGELNGKTPQENTAGKACLLSNISEGLAHNNIKSNYEDLYDIVKDKNNTLYKPLPIRDWNTSFEVDYAIAMERMMNHYITRHRCDFITFYRQHTNMKERFNYLFIEMILNKIFCFDIYNQIMSFI